MKIDGETVGLPTLTNVRAGRHGCYDRLVFDIRNVNVTWVRVAYESTIKARGGPVVPMRGGAKLSIIMYASILYSSDHDRVPTYRPTNRAEVVNVSGYRTFRQVALVDVYRNNSTFVGLGVRARLPFRVFQLPGRVVVDVAHRW